MKLANVLLLVSFIASASALHIPFEQRVSPVKRDRDDRDRDDRDHHDGHKPNSSDPYYFENLSNRVYAGTIYVDGQPFQVQLDTGSSDLWVDATGITFANVQNTSISGSLPYLDGSVAAGPILIGNVTFGSWTAPQQAFISAVGTNATTLGDKGLLGIGPPTLSVINQGLNGTSYNGESFLDNIFTAYPNDPNIITFLLSRSEGGNTKGGDFTIGSIVPGYESITQEPHLDVIAPNEWETLMDGVLIGGTLHSGNSQYLNGSQLSVILDSGTSYGTGTKVYVDAIYAGSPGAQWNATFNAYTFPCDNIYNVSFVFGQQEIFTHPIDLSAPVVFASDGSVLCAGLPVNDQSGFDFILGDLFLRNVYALYNFGNWTSSGNDTPYMQIAGITDPNQAFSEFASFNAQRVSYFKSTAANATSNATSNAVVNAISNGNASSASSSSQTVDLSAVNRNSYIIMGMAGIAILLLILNLVMGARSSKGYKQIGAPGSAPHPHFVDTAYPNPYDHDH